MVKRAPWLSLTPEPERELPAAVATLVCGRRPTDEAVADEAARIERLVLRGSERRWDSYLHDVVELIDAPRRRWRPGGGTSPRGRDRRDLEPPQPAARVFRGAARDEPTPTGGGSPSCSPRETRSKHEHRRKAPPSGAADKVHLPHDRRSELTSDQLELQQRARTFVETVLMPLELEAEELGGQLPEETIERDQARGDRRAAERRAVRPRVRRPGVVDARVVPRQRAVRPRHQRPALARAERLQRAARRAPPSRSSATSCRRFAARAATPTRSPRPRRALTRAGSRRPRSGRTAAGGSTARSGS